jgi:EAL domain-containing protein (putative c-di-GMP-specific phosphodiesterase class I)
VYETAMNRMQVESELQGAVERGEFEAFYQAIVDLNSMELAGFESLIRWRHPERGLLGPGEFFSVCEESGMVVPMTTWMLDASCAALARFKSAGRGRKLFVSVNLSARDFGRGDLVERVANALSVSGIRPESLKLEITESAIMENFDNAVAILEDLKKLGVMLSVDDFGTGYSSLSHLHKFPVDTLKVDRSFVSSMEFGSENGEIVRTVITLAKLLGMKIISEGIESLHQLHQLKVLECEYGQGYLFSKPVPEREALEMVEDRHRCFGLAPARATDTMTSVNPDAFVSKDTRTYPN